MPGSCGDAYGVGRGGRGKEQSLPSYRAVIWILMAVWLEYTVLSFQKIFGILQNRDEKTNVPQAHGNAALKGPHLSVLQAPAQDRHNPTLGGTTRASPV